MRRSMRIGRRGEFDSVCDWETVGVVHMFLLVHGWNTRLGERLSGAPTSWMTTDAAVFFFMDPP
jgi:hypothetical protein